MRVYNVVWSLVVVCLAAVGALEALLVVAPLTLWCAGVALAVLAGLFCVAFAVVGGPGRSSTGTVALAGGAGATLGVVTAGLAALLGGGTVALLIVLAGVHPRVLHGAVRRTQRWRSGIGTAATSTAAPPSFPTSSTQPTPTDPTSARPHGLAGKVVPSTSLFDPVWPDAAAVQQLSTAQLCWGWRLSFTALERTDPAFERVRWAALIAVRQRYLDELARREPAGFARWLYAGARPASDPTRYLQPSPATLPTSADEADEADEHEEHHD